VATGAQGPLQEGKEYAKGLRRDPVKLTSISSCFLSVQELRSRVEVGSFALFVFSKTLLSSSLVGCTGKVRVGVYPFGFLIGESIQFFLCFSVSTPIK
jgi:hypothetical protein